MKRDVDPFKVSSPRIFLVRMLVFPILVGLIVVVLHRQIWTAFVAKTAAQRADRRRAADRHHPVVPAGDPAVSRGELGQRLPPRRSRHRHGAPAGAAGADGDHFERARRPAVAVVGDDAQHPRFDRDRLDEARELSRYMTGLLVFLGLLGTFWGLIETVSSVGNVIEGLKVGGDARAVFDSLKEGLAAPLGGMGISFSSSLFGLAGSLVLGFLDLQSVRPRTGSTPTWKTGLRPPCAISASTITGGGAARPRLGEMRVALERLKESMAAAGSNKAATCAMANLAEAIQGLVHHMRTEQQMIRDWVESQAEQHHEISGCSSS